ncbi:MAG: oligosaccharide repeat unit polymerase [Salinivirgaceae bacterium]|nr:oligosaccharide repeat unit polymerase [Salinivirgaceae bacterium]
MVIVGIIGCLLVLLFVHTVLKDFKSPPFILGALWLFAYVSLYIFKGGIANFNSIYYLSFLIGLCFFVFGFFLKVGNRNRINSNIIFERKSYIRFKLPYIQIFLLIAFILFLIYIIKAALFVSKEFDFNFWRTLSRGRKTGDLNIPLVVEYSRSAIIALSTVCGIIYFSNSSKLNRRHFIFSSIIALFYVVTAGNRGAIFLWVLSLTFSYLIIKNFDNRKLFSILWKMALIIIGIFVVTNFAKYVYTDQSDPLKFSINLIGHYFSSSTVAFVEWMKLPRDYLFGANTFRFFLAILDAIGMDVKVPELIQEEIHFYGDKTNIYTVLHYYTKDFGLLYAFVMQLLMGMFYGVLYTHSTLSKKLNIFYIALLSILYFPLINQFFDDKYFSILSSWIQLFFWIWLFTRKLFLTGDEIVVDDEIT